MANQQPDPASQQEQAKRRAASKTVVTGVYEELKKMDSMNQTWHGSFSTHSHSTANTKALKNYSHGVTNLIENRPMHAYNS